MNNGSSIIDEAQAPIDPAVERSRLLVEGLSDLAVAITNHPELAAPGATVALSVLCPTVEDARALAGGIGRSTEGSGHATFHATVELGNGVRIDAWAWAEKCEHCGR